MAKSKQAIFNSVHQRLLNEARDSGRLFGELIEHIEAFLWPVAMSIQGRSTFSPIWELGKGWN